MLALLAANLLNLDTGLTSGNAFRGEVDSVQGQRILARNFPAGASAPTDVIVPDRGRARAVAAALTERTELVSRVSRPITGAPGVRLSVTLVDAPYDPKTLAQVPELRRVAKRAGGQATLVGGPTAQEYDLAPVRGPRQPRDVQEGGRADALAGRNHPLVDGNKRLAWLATYVLCAKNGVELDPPDDEAYDLVMAPAAGRLDDVAVIAEALDPLNACRRPRARTLVRARVATACRRRSRRSRPASPCRSRRRRACPRRRGRRS